MLPTGIQANIDRRQKSGFRLLDSVAFMIYSGSMNSSLPNRQPFSKLISMEP